MKKAYVPAHMIAPEKKPKKQTPGTQKTRTRPQRRFALPPLLCLLLTVVYLELLLRASCSLPLFHAGLPGALLTAFTFAALASLLCYLPPSSTASRWICILLMEVFTVWFVIAFFMDNSYTVFMSPTIIAQETGNVMTDFGGNVKNAIVLGLPMILLYHIPVLLAVVFHRCIAVRDGRRRLALLLSLALLILSVPGAYLLNTRNEELRTAYKVRHTYDNAVRNFGLLSALQQEITSPLRREQMTFSTVPAQPTPAAAGSAASAPQSTAAPQSGTDAPQQTEEAPVEYGQNVMDLDFSNCRDYSVSAVTEYVQSRVPTSKNKYTGLFSGKNLILITAEAFSKEVIDPELTPTLYRLANKGIVFEDFYQPSWGGSTSTGEYSWLMGLAPTNSMTMMESFNKNLYFTMGNQLQRLGYFSRAYHNGSYDYYSRDKTHCNLGYSAFYGVGNGLEAGLTGGLFPNSDKEMFEYTVSQYIDRQPFSVYYMTISGHASYGFNASVNDMSMKNRDAVEKLPYSEPVRAYLACNLELEYAMASLVKSLEDAGIADDTVIAMVPDHYPYGLGASAAWGNTGDYLAELYGYPADTPWKRDHNVAIIWCGELEKLDEPITVSGPVSSIDILPTLSNLFGLEYDSRLMAGNDVFSGAERLVFWNDFSWLTEKGCYRSQGSLFTPLNGAEVDQAYIDRIHADVRNKILLSTAISNYDYYGRLFGKDTVQ